MSTRRIAVVGAGPSALFLVAALLDRYPDPLRFDVIDRLPAPYGLVRYGVAPDHANIKAIIGTLRKVFERENVRFLGNVEFGKALTLDDLRRHYDAICFAVGASRDRRLDVPGEELEGSLSATDFVMWYSGHPDAALGSPIHRTIAAVLPRVRTAAVIGAGNVAIDVARILAKPIGELRTTDMPDYVLDVLACNRIRDIHLIARRGPAQAKFTTAELRELGEIPGVGVAIDPKVLDLDEASAASIASSAIGKRNMDALREFAIKDFGDAARRIHLRFFLSPARLSGNGRVEALLLEKNALDERLNAAPLGQTERLEAELVLRSVGYRGVALDGVPFDERRGVIPHESGRVRDAGNTLPGLYAVGWIKRGPTGVIGTNKADAVETAKAIAADLPWLPPCADPQPEAVDALLRERGVRVVDWQGWLELDRREIEAGAKSGRARVKLIDFDFDPV
jgi:ferredoxin--NADP+ reductase